MKSMKAHVPPATRGLLACLLTATGLPAGALGLGELQAHSGLGEPLHATVGLDAGAGEIPRADCFSLGRPPNPALPSLPRATFAVEAQAGGWLLRVRTRAVVNEPVLRFRLVAACHPATTTSRDYDLLLDPRPAVAQPSFPSVPGDTLASLAAAIFPRDRAARDAYVRALRTANPALAGLGADEPIPPGSATVLPDLRQFSLDLALAAAPPPVRPVAPPFAPRVETAPAKPPAASIPPRAEAPPAKPATTVAPRAPTPPTATAPAGGGRFALRLSSPQLDLSRSRGVDERRRAELRERLALLDSDDQMATYLALRHQVRQLGSRLTQMQLQLSAMPAAAPAPVAVAKPATPTPAPSPVTPSPAPLSAKPAPAAAPAPPAASKKPPTPVAQAPAKGEPGTSPVVDFVAKWWLWGALALVLAAIAVLLWRVLSRPGKNALATAAGPGLMSALEEAEAQMRGGSDADLRMPPAFDHRVVAESDANLATLVPGADPVDLRRRYIEERFPEIAGGTISAEEPDSVVKAARLFYEDGAMARAVELLQFTVEENPAAMKPWLALFEIFRLEGLVGEFAELARRFRDHHDTSENWRKVQFIGREIDPQNPLYHEAPVNALETMAFPAAQAAPVTFDPLAENWLNAPMDFSTDALAASLRAAVLADAGVGEPDLAADPMPALKNVEIFHVA